ncbi:hypothetical protein [Streptomyces sp. PSAA01]|nr:hypothetical protein [Streptomyces sp. PSAA01]
MVSSVRRRSPWYRAPALRAIGLFEVFQPLSPEVERILSEVA